MRVSTLSSYFVTYFDGFMHVELKLVGKQLFQLYSYALEKERQRKMLGYINQ